MFGTIMAFNVWFRIWPAQQKIITRDQGRRRRPTPALVALAGTRSKHNTYMSVPLVVDDDQPAHDLGVRPLGLGDLAGDRAAGLVDRHDALQACPEGEGLLARGRARRLDRCDPPPAEGRALSGGKRRAPWGAGSRARAPSRPRRKRTRRRSDAQRVATHPPPRFVTRGRGPPAFTDAARAAKRTRSGTEARSIEGGPGRSPCPLDHL